MSIEDTTESHDPAILSEDIDFYEKAYKTKEVGIQVVCFRISNEWYAAEIHKIIEVIPASQLTILPGAPAYIAGITNLRGEIISVTDPKNLFGLEWVPHSGKTRIVVISEKKVETGLLVDEVSQVLDVANHQIDPPLSTLSTERAHYLKGEFMRQGQLVTILDIENIITKTKYQHEDKSSAIR